MGSDRPWHAETATKVYALERREEREEMKNPKFRIVPTSCIYAQWRLEKKVLFGWIRIKESNDFQFLVDLTYHLRTKAWEMK